MDELKKRLRKNFRDDQKLQWSDALLDEIIFEAQREYAIYSGGVTGKLDIITENTAVMILPEDFFQVIGAIAPDGWDIPIVSYRKLAERYGDFRNHKGNCVKALCFNFDGFGKMRIYPQVPEGCFAGTLYYKRLPVQGEELPFNAAAVEYYALFLMCQFAGKAQAQSYYSAFMESVYQEQKQKVAFGNKNAVRTGRFF